MPVWILGLFFLSGLMVVTGLAFVIWAPSDIVKLRLAQIANRLAPSALQTESRPITKNLLEWVRKTFQIDISKILPVSKASPAMQGRMIRAGYHNQDATQVFVGTRLFLGLGLFLINAVVFYMLEAPVGDILLSSSVLAPAGFLIPNLWLNRRIRSRKTAIHRGLPDFLDLLIICVEAGQGLDQALVRVGNELQASNPIFAQELHILNLEVKSAKSRQEALRNLYERTQVEDLKSFSAMLIMTERYGVSIANSLRIFSESLRTSRRQAAEEAAAKTIIKIAFPLVCFIFPALMVVILGPAVFQIMVGLTGK
jgi:tight adherence protein C